MGAVSLNDYSVIQTSPFVIVDFSESFLEKCEVF